MCVCVGQKGRAPQNTYGMVDNIIVVIYTTKFAQNTFTGKIGTFVRCHGRIVLLSVICEAKEYIFNNYADCKA
jgi:hypothetical protein